MPRVALAWGVHIFTASGAVVGVAALLAIASGDLRVAAVLMLIALFIDAVDGTLARAVRVHEALPDFDGRRLDDMVDYLNYVIVPAVFLAGAGLVPSWVWTVPPVLASAYGFSQSQAKTDDGFFLGFPSYWNVVALYAWLLTLAPGWTAALLVILSIAVFVPIKYIYPSQMPVLQKSTNLLGALWFASMLFAVVTAEGAVSRPLAQVSLLFPVWYLGLSFWHGGLLRSRAA